MKAASLGRKYVLVSVCRASAAFSPDRSSSAARHRNSSALADTKPAGESAGGSKEGSNRCGACLQAHVAFCKAVSWRQPVFVQAPRCAVLVMQYRQPHWQPHARLTNDGALAAADCRAQQKAQQCRRRRCCPHDAACRTGVARLLVTALALCREQQHRPATSRELKLFKGRPLPQAVCGTPYTTHTHTAQTGIG